MSSMPIQKPGQSEQVVCTPPEFLAELKARLQIKEFAIDLAADASNSVAAKFYSEADDAIIQKWTVDGWGWCNPPYSSIAPWVHKAWIESAAFGAHVAMLVPASVGSNWWADSVHDKAHVMFVRPRLTFVGHKNPYPKDLAVLLYTPAIRGGYSLWGWK